MTKDRTCVVIGVVDTLNQVEKVHRLPITARFWWDATPVSLRPDLQVKVSGSRRSRRVDFYYLDGGDSKRKPEPLNHTCLGFGKRKHRFKDGDLLDNIELALSLPERRFPFIFR